jgi:Xaa-Pro aminopeptidase
MAPQRPITKEKIIEITQVMEEANIDALLLYDFENANDVNVRYLSGNPDAALLMLTQSGETVLLPWDYPLAQNLAKVDEIINFEDYNKSYLQAIKPMFQRLKNNPTIALGKSWPYERLLNYFEEYPNIEFVVNHAVLAKLNDVRSTKTAIEIETTRRAAAIHNKVLILVEEFLNENKKVKESDLAAFVYSEFIKGEADDISFSSLIANVDRSWQIHCVPPSSQAELTKTGLALMDFGCKLDGYVTDVTIPFAFGELSADQLKIWRKLQEVYEDAANYYTPGEPTWKAHHFVIDELAKENYSMPHGLGHGIGLIVHDSPRITRKPTNETEIASWTEEIFKPGQLVTLEPGIYVEGLGGCRWENDVLITEKGHEFLTNCKPMQF